MFMVASPFYSTYQLQDFLGAYSCMVWSRMAFALEPGVFVLCLVVSTGVCQKFGV
jgi:hypothetical protein